MLSPPRLLVAAAVLAAALGPLLSASRCSRSACVPPVPASPFRTVSTAEPRLTLPAVCRPGLISSGRQGEAPLWVFGDAGRGAAAEAGFNVTDGGFALRDTPLRSSVQVRWERLRRSLDGTMRRAVDWDLPKAAPAADLPDLDCPVSYRDWCFSCCTAHHSPRCPSDPSEVTKIKLRSWRHLQAMRAMAKQQSAFSRVGAALLGSQRRTFPGVFTDGRLQVFGAGAHEVAQVLTAWEVPATAQPGIRPPAELCRRNVSRVVAIPPNGFMHNVGHLLAEALSAVLEARAALPGVPVDYILASSKLNRTAHGPSHQEAFEAVAPIGKPAAGTCVEHVQLACPAEPCPFVVRRGRTMPALRRFFAKTFKTRALQPRAVAEQQPHMIVAVRYPGSRFIDNAGALAEIARGRGWRVTQLLLWRDCGDRWDQCADVLQSADVFVSWHGTDIDRFLYFYAGPAAVVEVNIVTAMQLAHWQADGVSQVWQASWLPDVTYFAWFIPLVTGQSPPLVGESNVHKVKNVTVGLGDWQAMLERLEPTLRVVLGRT
eukprot:TRINITY_DN15839_c0_g1_i2.p1 TRINITY_DN15839_c0_g1~~TRINITY_DN15839_c0_g1_i2.p1  ORF type:complete len:543 (+),score=145.64 TRINITY_DN15839_c0_g1_i2:51-1679(+)